MKFAFVRIALLAGLAVALASPAMAGTTGGISGIVMESERTGPIAGVTRDRDEPVADTRTR